MADTSESAMLGLSKEVILKMLKKGVPVHSYEGYAEWVHRHVIPNIAEVIVANNEAIMFHLKDGTKYDSKY